jgi:HD-like signal output (HDOD) protein
MSENECLGKILFVDDDNKILKALYRAFFQADFEVFTALGGREGLKILEKEDIDIVITDYKMPEMNGLKFLEQVKQRFPSVYRAILSGFVEESEIYRSMTSGLTLTYFLKPWDDEALKKRIIHILQVRSHLKNQQLISKINAIRNLPVLPAIFSTLTDAIAQDRPMKDIFKIIEKDISISTKVLQIANSAFYTTHHYISLERVIIYLGINTIKDIVFTLSLHNQMKWDDSQIGHLQQISIHSILVNRYVARLYEVLFETGLSDRNATIGLTHDIGKIILLQYFPQRYAEITEQMKKEPHLDFYQCENSLGDNDNTHCEIGGYFLDSWNFAEPVVDSALFHHTPELTTVEYSDILKVMYLTDQLINHATQGKTRETFVLPEQGKDVTVRAETFITEVYDDIQRDLECEIRQAGKTFGQS